MSSRAEGHAITSISIATAPGRSAGLARPGTAALVVVLSGAFMVVLDFFIVMVTLPSIRADLAASGAQLQLVVTGYGVAAAAGLITGGRLGDRFGRRRMFSLGLLLFTLTSAACGLATSASMLIAARVAQGMAGALLQPQVLAILGLSYQGRARTRAFSAYALAMGAAGVLGQLIGGALLEADLGGLGGWRACFLINVPVGLAALLLTPRFVPRLRSRSTSRLDVVGMGLTASLLAALITPLIEGRQQSWPLWSLLMLGATVPLALLLSWHQRSLAARGGQPLLAPALMTRPAFASALLAVFVFYGGTASFYFVLALYLQQGFGMSPLASGAMFSVLGIGFFVTSLLVRPISAWLRGRHLQAGALLLALAHTLQALLVVSPALHWSLMLPLLLAQGAGLGLVMAPLASAALLDVPPAQAGLASGLLATVQHTGNSTGVALIGLVFYGFMGPPPTYTPARAYAAALLYLVTLALVLVFVLRRRAQRLEAAKLTRPPAA